MCDQARIRIPSGSYPLGVILVFIVIPVSLPPGCWGVKTFRSSAKVNTLGRDPDRGLFREKLGKSVAPVSSEYENSAVSAYH
ncbi:hypothetical protein EDD16DRAFT_1631039 [Pisolithus croceorrhizus]|nr:hypothetical protein EDD16DRAFT_1631039 [Pisolithus croceorrhizus]